MDTKEHTEVGNQLRFGDWLELKDNPYIHIDEETGILSLDLQRIDENNLPKSTNLRLTSGNMVAMSGDYFGGREVEFDLPSMTEFRGNPGAYDDSISLGHYLINKPVFPEDEHKFVASYRRLANLEVSQDEINLIYEIDGANYIPFSNTLNGYAQELMYALRVKNYGDMLTRNLSHFTPWSVRAYVVGHHLALQYASFSYEFRQLAENPDYESNNEEFNKVRAYIELTPGGLSANNCRDLAHRYQALALGMELFCFHYYSDHYAAGHCQPVGDLRQVLPEKFGTWGSILVNNIHDECNNVSIYTTRPYDSNLDKNDPPVEMTGDGDFDESRNYYNKQACVAGMQSSVGDLRRVFGGSPLPNQTEYAGLAHLPDIDENYRQHQPLFVLGADNKVYYRTELSKIRILSPSQWKTTYESPLENGYTELSSTWEAFVLVCKLRLLSFIYQGEVQPLSEAEREAIEREEFELNPQRRPIPTPPRTLEETPVPLANWKTKPASSREMVRGMDNFGVLSGSSGQRPNSSHVLEQEGESILSL
ncbi:hypothetical protein BN59_02685 [Legionella massiliensis]|uniref:Dot/Icm T4SS effector n=1 Tax=Legionella massiliensis TaxID=1034943 RepID=A0A078KVA7_9GAMM|nr:hypothetical protein [Legionella massiliensis]CDZ78375.1 hypothetical protein BN59_02685 [Legionella massiliensis]CEE14113.1 hypothetical protein BN1094_02685 [Legionella massiliensis]